MIARFFVSGVKENKGQLAQSVLAALLSNYRLVRPEGFRRFTKYRFYVRRGNELDERV